MKKTDLAYAAGIIDGEGNIGIWKHNSKTCLCGYTFGLVVRVGMSESNVPTWLYDKFGGNLKQYPGERYFDKDVHVWVIQARQALIFLELISTFLVEKGEQARVAINFQNTKKYNKDRYHPKTSGELAQEESSYQKLKELHRGTSNVRQN